MINCTISPQLFTFPSSNGSDTIQGYQWHPLQQSPRGIIQLVHGLSEHMGRYQDVAERFAQAGYLVVAHDHLGHGKSAPTPEHHGFFAMEHGWDCVVQDMEYVRRETAQAYPHLPYFLLGHSMGSFVVRTYLLEHSHDLDGCILSGTRHGGKALLYGGYGLARILRCFKGPRKCSPFLYHLSMGAYNTPFRPNRTPADWITRDEASVDSYMADPMCQFPPTIGMFCDMLGGLIVLSKDIPQGKISPNLPIYLLSGTQDPVGDMGKGAPLACEQLKKAGVTSVTLNMYQGGRHEMFHEENKDEVYHDLFQWLENVAPQ